MVVSVLVNCIIFIMEQLALSDQRKNLFLKNAIIFLVYQRMKIVVILKAIQYQVVI